MTPKRKSSAAARAAKAVGKGILGLPSANRRATNAWLYGPPPKPRPKRDRGAALLPYSAVVGTVLAGAVVSVWLYERWPWAWLALLVGCVVWAACAYGRERPAAEVERPVVGAAGEEHGSLGGRARGVHR